jgi:hypothetical protein
MTNPQDIPVTHVVLSDVLVVTPVVGPGVVVVAGPIPLIEHKACGTHFLRTEACPRCGKMLLEG